MTILEGMTQEDLVKWVEDERSRAQRRAYAKDHPREAEHLKEVEDRYYRLVSAFQRAAVSTNIEEVDRLAGYIAKEQHETFRQFFYAKQRYALFLATWIPRVAFRQGDGRLVELESIPDPEPIRADRSSCDCFHAPEQHRASVGGCEVFGCRCKRVP